VYLAYYLLSPEQQYKLVGSANGSTVAHINLPNIRNLRIDIPGLSTQTKIANIMSAYDDLIEGNVKKIAVLEQTMEKLYKEWFIRYRFPGYETFEFVDGVPAGWEYVKLGDILSFERGISYSSDEIDCDEGLNLINLKNIDAFGGFRRDGTKTYNGKYKESHMVKKGDLVIGVTDMTQDRRTVGAAAMIPTIEGLSVISADLVKVISNVPNVYLYSLCRYGFYSRYFSQFANGANVLHLKPGTLLNKKLLLPTKNIIDAFVEKASAIIELIDGLNLANDNLTKQRDLLLPRLMSGKLEV
jgi:type I restriction enzyme S subunit